ncbi:MAG: dephospho-CoA kinase [Pseudomonadota bacterium]
MGKSETARMFAALGARIYDADAAVHALYQKGGEAVAPIGAVFPEAIVEDAVDRAKLSQEVLNDREALRQLEAIVHPLVRKAQGRFIEKAKAEGAALAVLDVPLLFETGGDAAVDKVLVVTAPLEVQRARVLARPGMTEEKFQAIRAKQMPEAEKTARADFVLTTDKGLEAAAAAVEGIFHELTASHPSSVEPGAE